MINCAHPTHFDDVLDGGGAWKERIRGLRANASTESHAELDEPTSSTRAIPRTWAARYAALRAQLPAPHRDRRLLRHRPPPRGQRLRGPGQLSLNASASCGGAGSESVSTGVPTNCERMPSIQCRQRSVSSLSLV